MKIQTSYFFIFNSFIRKTFLQFNLILFLFTPSFILSSPNQALLESIAEGDFSGVIKAIQNQANVNVRGKGGYTPLMDAAWNGYSDIVEYLVLSGAWIDAKSKNGYTPLMLASVQGHIDVVKILIQSNAKLNLRNKNGETALLMAKRKRLNHIVKLLKNFGAK